MISMVLNTYRFETKQNHLYYEKFDLSQVVVESFEKASKEAKEKEIQFVYKSTNDNTFLEADREEIKKVVINLLNNAIVYSSRGEKIVVCVENENNNLKFSVTSRGISLSNKECLNLFERTSEKNPKFSTVGHGISLYLCKKIIDVHNGKIYASTDGDLVNTFTFVVPQFRQNILPNPVVPLYL